MGLYYSADINYPRSLFLFSNNRLRADYITGLYVDRWTFFSFQHVDNQNN